MPIWDSSSLTIRPGGLTLALEIVEFLPEVMYLPLQANPLRLQPFPLAPDLLEAAAGFIDILLRREYRGEQNEQGEHCEPADAAAETDAVGKPSGPTWTRHFADAAPRSPDCPPIR